MPGALLTIGGEAKEPPTASRPAPDACDALRADHEMNALARALYRLQR